MSQSYQTAPPPPNYTTDNYCECTCCGLYVSCKKPHSVDKIRLLERLFAYYIIILGVIGITLTCLDPVGNLTYTFPTSTTDTVAHKWDCMHFQAYGLVLGCILIICGLIVNKSSKNTLASIVVLLTFIGLCVAIIILAVVTGWNARQNSVNDPDNTKDYAITNEGYPINGVSCGTYMYDHHKMGLFGSCVYSIGLVGPLAIVLIGFALYYLLCVILYLFSCKSVCPEINQSIEEQC